MIVFRDTAARTTELLTRGYTHVQPCDILMATDAQVALHALQDCFHRLQPDSPGRSRAYLQLVLMPGSTDVDLSRDNPAVLGSSYWQTTEHNAEAGGQVRHFAPLDPFARANPALRALVAADLRASGIERVYPPAARLPILCGIHMVRLTATAGQPAVALPNRPHKDGELFSWVHMICRHGVEGGESEFYDNGPDGTVGPMRFLAPLQFPMETLGICDPCGFHGVREVRVASGYSVGWRDIVIVDFAPLASVLIGVNGQPSAVVPSLKQRIPACLE